MHNNFFVIKPLVAALITILKNGKLIECFSQNRDELIMIFQKENNDVFYIQAQLGSQFSILHFPNQFNRAKKNTVTLFEEVTNVNIHSITMFENERAFDIKLQNSFHLIFKLFGNRSNIILYKNKAVVKLFKKELKLDWHLTPESLNRKADWSFEKFVLENCQIEKTVFTIGKLGMIQFQKLVNDFMSLEEKYSQLQEVIKMCQSPLFYIIKLNEKISFSIFPLGEIIKEYNNIIEALNAFYYLHFKYNVVADLRSNLLKSNEKDSKIANLQLTKYSKTLDDLVTAKPLEHIANIIMANLHLYQDKKAPEYLFDFYENKNIKVELPPTLNAQTYAALLYKKSKNKHLAQGQLKKQIEEKQSLIAALASEKDLILNAATHKELVTFEKTNNQQSKSKTIEQTSLFHTYEMMGFKIWIGKNAKNNDVLTQKYTYKDDLWLHAKDVAGSHVVIKYQSGKPYPKPVIEKAATIAAYYSKRKTDSLCPVIYTLKKYVRKVKGSADGAVKVDKEQIIMVVPQAI